ncbi:MAG: hypothetical protein ACPLSN_09615 [Dictyoglomus turgidum]
MRIFTSKTTAQKYVELLYASQGTPLWDMLVKDTWLSIQKTFPGVRAAFFAGLQEKGLLEKYLKRAEELAGGR